MNESETTGTYTNPVGGRIRMGDPFVLKHEGLYYLYGGGHGRFKCWTSRDLVNWQDGGFVYRHDQHPWGEGSFWAPEVVAYQGRFYMIFSCLLDKEKGFRISLIVADRPEGPFENFQTPWFDNGWSCIDGDVFVDDDGTPYLFFDKVGVVGDPRAEPSTGYMFGIIYAMELARDLSGPVGEPVLCIQAEQEWEDPQSMFSRCNEGAFVLKHDATYYMTYSASHFARPTYGIGYATAPTPLGPWTKSDNCQIVRTDPEAGVIAPGHNCITTSPDGSELFMVYHTHAPPGLEPGGRVVNIDRLVFDADGALRLIGPTRTPQPLPSGSSSEGA